MLYSTLFLSAIFFDLLVGDPSWYPHPVRIIGTLCSRTESTVRALFSNESLAGFITVFIVLGVTAATSFILLIGAGALLPGVQNIASVFLLYTSVAIRDLLKESQNVYNCLAAKRPVEECQQAVGRIVGRQTDTLDRGGVCRACIETVAENLVDGIISPLFYGVLASFAGGFLGISAIGWTAVGALVYKAVNTMDSMIGYKNSRYIRFGRWAARLDDFVNFLPARMSGCALIFTAFIMRLDWKNGWKYFLIDRLAHSSPNAGHTEAVVAGVLGIKLGGPSWYHGVLVKKPWLGEDLGNATEDDIVRTNRLVLGGTATVVTLLLFIRLAFEGWLRGVF